jgi:outer membrane protein TolC
VKGRRVDLDLAGRRLGLAQTRLEEGVGTELEVVQAEAQRASAADRYWAALSLYRTAQVGLAHALAEMEKLGGAGKRG